MAVLDEHDRCSGDGKSIFQRLGPASGKGQPDRRAKVCYKWKAGRCNRHPCPFAHAQPPPAALNRFTWRRDGTGGSGTGQNGGLHRRQDTDNGRSKGGAGTGQVSKPCKYFLVGNCTYGDRCRFLHSCSVERNPLEQKKLLQSEAISSRSSVGNALSLITPLKGHQKVISSIALPSGSNKLYSGSMDGKVMEWDCHTGQCIANVSLGGEVGSMIIEEPWLFVGIPNLIKVWNTENGAEMSLPGPIGQVHALVAANDMLFAGAEDGRILVWRFSVATYSFEPATSLLGHRLAVISLVVGGTKLYSGSMDNTIKAWDLTTLQCDQTLPDHTNVVMSMLCWDQFLLSGSLDKTIKIWAMNEKNQLEVTYTHVEENGVVTMCGMHNLQGKPVLLVALNDNTVHIYDLPSFHERGIIQSMLEVRSMATGPGGLLFTGDGSGELRVWQWPDM